MSFYNVYKQHQPDWIDGQLRNIAEKDIARALNKESLDKNDFLALLSENAGDRLEDMAKRAGELTLNNFGRVIYLYAPLYLSNYCENECTYCGFKNSNNIARKKLSMSELEDEAKLIISTGMRHILVLSGESRKETPLSYIKESIGVLKNYFSSISIEVYPLLNEEYAGLISDGVDGLTIYQETYDEVLYEKLHIKGPKRNYRFRLDAPERSCIAKMRSVNIGALLGLSDFKKEIFLAGLHAYYLQYHYPDTEIGISFPRIQPQTGSFVPSNPVSDRELVQAIVAMRLFMPRAAITISTRESGSFRNNLIGLGVTRMSAGSRTEVGGYASSEKSEGQFDVADNSSVSEVKKMIELKGFQPVMKDWQRV